MKPITCLLAFLLGFSLISSAQKTAPLRELDYSKPKLFLSLPLVVPVAMQQLDSVLRQPQGKPVSFQLAPGVRFQGLVVSKADGYDPGLESVVVRMNAPASLTFSISRRTTDTGVNYTARLLSQDHGDALELVADNNGYHFEKRDLYELLSN